MPRDDPKPFGEAEAKALMEDAVRILREDMTRTELRKFGSRLDDIEKQTRREPQTAEEKAAAWDEYQKSQQQHPAPPTPPAPTPPPPGPTPPAPKPADPPEPPKKDPWWGDRLT